MPTSHHWTMYIYQAKKVSLLMPMYGFRVFKVQGLELGALDF
jgi:hypothetical protein